MLMAAVALEMRLEYPDPRCDERKSDRKCLKFTVVYNDHELCRWDDASGTCSVNPPPDDAFGDFSHLLVVLFVIGITLPCQKVYEWAVLDVLARTWLCSGHLWRDVEDAAARAAREVQEDVERAARAGVFVLASAGVSVRFDGSKTRLPSPRRRTASRAPRANCETPQPTRCTPSRPPPRTNCAPSRAPSVPAGVPSGPSTIPTSRAPPRRRPCPRRASRRRRPAARRRAPRTSAAGVARARAWDAVSPRLRAVLAFREASRTTTPTPRTLADDGAFADDGADEAPPRPPSQDPPPPRVASAATGGSTRTRRAGGRAPGQARRRRRGRRHRPRLDARRRRGRRRGRPGRAGRGPGGPALARVLRRRARPQLLLQRLHGREPLAAAGRALRAVLTPPSGARARRRCRARR